MSIRQHEDKSLQYFVKRFNATTMITKYVSEEFAGQGFMPSTTNQHLKYNLVYKSPTSYLSFMRQHIGSLRVMRWEKHK